MIRMCGINKCDINIKRAVSALLITVLYFAVVFMIFDAVYAINDDLMIQSVLSGSYYEIYPFTYYFSVVLGVIIAGLYAISPGIGWLGLFFISVFFICLFFILYRNLGISDSPVKKAVILVITLLAYTFLCLKSLIMLHYTVVAAVAGATGIYLFVTKKDNKGLVVPIILFVLTYLIRVKVFFMVMCFVTVAFLALILKEGLKSIKSYIPYILSFLGAMVIVLILNYLPMLNEEWREYVDYNDVRTTVYDYTGVACDDYAVDYYEKNGMSRDTMELYRSYNILLKNKDTYDDLVLIGEYGNIRINETSTIQRLKDAFVTYFYRVIKKWPDIPFNYFAVFLYFVVFATVIICGKYKMLVPIIASGLGRSVLWLYLIFMGRYPERVTLSLYIIEIFLLMGIFVFVLGDHKPDNKVKQVIATTIVSILGFAFLCCGIYDIKHAIEPYKRIVNDNSAMDVLYSYMGEHPDNMYFMDVYATVTRTMYAVKDYETLQENYMVLGGWEIGSPLAEKKMDYIGASNASIALCENENTYLVIKDGVGASLQDFNTWIGATGVLADTVETSVGTYYIYSWTELEE